MREVSGGITAVKGLLAGAGRAGLKRPGNDVALLYAPEGAAVAGVFTTNRFQAAPVRWTRRQVARGRAFAVVANSGNANAATGPAGERDAARMAELVAELLSVPARQVMVASTGVIGRPLPMKKIEAGIRQAAASLRADGGPAAARAIMTTDTRPKECAVAFSLGGRTVHLGGMAKGAAMIAPSLATTLAFLATDAAADPAVLRACLRTAADRSFNRITVEGDTSTNDTILLLATGQTGRLTAANRRAFQTALDEVMTRLARAIVLDAEGATKFVTVVVRGAAREADARRVAMTIANSVLVKTALAGADPNWGRVLAAAGRSGVRFDPDRVELRLGDVVVVRRGRPTDYDPEQAHRAVAGREVTIDLHLRAGRAASTVWTCDLTAEYVRLNAEYTS